MANGEETLQHYGAQNDFTIHVIDTDPTSILKDFDDLSKVEKYVIPDDKYNERDDTFRKFKQKMI